MSGVKRQAINRLDVRDNISCCTPVETQLTKDYFWTVNRKHYRPAGGGLKAVVGSPIFFYILNGSS